MIDIVALVNRSAYMDFKKATDDLFAGISHEDLARALGVSVAAIRQARLDPKAKAYRLLLQSALCLASWLTQAASPYRTLP